MEDIIAKLGEILSDEDSVKQLSELAQMLETENDNGEKQTKDDKTEESSIDMEKILKLTGMLSSISEKDKNAELLLALRPHLKEEKQKRVDKAIKLLKIIAIWNMAKENGLLNDILQKEMGTY